MRLHTPRRPWFPSEFPWETRGVREGLAPQQLRQGGEDVLADVSRRLPRRRELDAPLRVRPVRGEAPSSALHCWRRGSRGTGGKYDLSAYF